VEKREAELKFTKMQLKERVAAKEAEVVAKEAEVGKMEERVAAKEAELKFTKMQLEARLETAELKWKVENAALASSNTQLLRYKRKCVRANMCV
jgi:hypothetical protein